TTDVRTPLLTALIHPGTDPASSARPPAPETRPVPLRPVPATPPSRRRLHPTTDTHPSPAPAPDDRLRPVPDGAPHDTAATRPAPTPASDGPLEPTTPPAQQPGTTPPPDDRLGPAPDAGPRPAQ